MAEHKLEVLLALRDELTAKMKEADKAIKSFGGSSVSTTNSISGFNKTVKESTKPFNDLRLAVMRITRITAFGTAGFYAYTKVLDETAKKVKELDSLSIKLGVSSSELSKKIYGTDLTSSTNRVGLAWWDTIKQGFGKGIAQIGGATTALSGLAAQNRKQQELIEQLQQGPKGLLGPAVSGKDIYDQTWKAAGASIMAQGKTAKESSVEALNYVAEVKAKTLEMNSGMIVSVQERFKQEVAAYRTAGVDEKTLVDYQTAFEKRANDERQIAVLKSQAAELTAKGQTIEAQKKLDEAALIEYKQKYGESGEMVDAYKAAQDAIASERSRQYQNEISSLKANLLQVRGDRLEALKLTHSLELEEVRRSSAEKARILEETQKAIQAQETITGQMWKDIGSSMTSSLGEAFADVKTGFKNLKTVAADFGDSLISILSEAAAKALLFNTIGTATTSFFGYNIFSYHTGGVIRRAHSGYLASDEVPIIAQAGEGIISRKGMSKLGASNLQKLNSGQDAGGGDTYVVQPVITIKAFDATDIVRNQETIQGIIADAVRRNTPLRGTLRKYT